MNRHEPTWHGLGIALDAADLVGVEVDPATRTATVTFLVPAPPEGDHSRPPVVQLLLHPVARVTASLHRQAPRTLADLPGLVRSFGPTPLRGQRCFDRGAAGGDHPTLDWRSGHGEGRHSLRLHQAGPGRSLDLGFDFDDLELLDERGLRVHVDTFVAAARGGR